MKLQPHVATRWTLRAILLAAVGVVWWGFSQAQFVRVSDDDHSTPDLGPGTLLWVRSLEQDQNELWPGQLYLAVYNWPPGSDELDLRLVRLAGLPGEPIEKLEKQVAVGGRVLPVPRVEAFDWPEQVPEQHCVVLTDVPFAPEPHPLHRDSRQLGPIAVEGLRYRVVASLPF